MRKLLMVVVFCFFAHGATAQETMQSFVDEQLKALATHVDVAKERLNFTGDVKIEIATPARARMHDNHAMWIERGEAENTYTYFIQEFSLLRLNGLSMQHWATHEICHATMNHFGRHAPEKIMRDEALAERCVYDAVGEEAYVAHAYAFMRGATPESASHSWSEVRQGVRHSFGIASTK